MLLMTIRWSDASLYFSRCDENNLFQWFLVAAGGRLFDNALNQYLGVSDSFQTN